MTVAETKSIICLIDFCLGEQLQKNLQMVIEQQRKQLKSMLYQQKQRTKLENNLDSPKN
jgi:hypothetical protein